MKSKELESQLFDISLRHHLLQKRIAVLEELMGGRCVITDEKLFVRFNPDDKDMVEVKP